MSSYKCVLRGLSGKHPPISLPHRQAVKIGRSQETRIKDKKVSRHHVELMADCIHREVTVHQLGANSCYISDRELRKGHSSKLRPDKTLYLLADKQYPYQVGFKIHKQNHGKISIDALKEELSGSEESMDTTPPKTRPGRDSDDEEEHLKDVEAKLRQMKDTVKAPGANTTSTMTPGGQSGDSGSDQQGEPVTEASWMEKDTLMVYRSKGLRASSKVAAFDIDGTIICTQSGRVFPTHPGDWRILYTEIPGCLKKLLRDGYKIVFITNQMGIQKGKVKIPDFQQKVQNIISKLGIPVHVLVSKGAGPYRKPGQGMWTYLTQQGNDGIVINKSKSLYVGDAAGRPKDWAPGKKKDFSCSDRLFAMNAGLRFQTPEEFFLNKSAAKYDLPEFDPRVIDPSATLLSPSGSKLVAGHQEVIVCVGSPASGKSHFVREYLIPKEYVHVNRDTLKTWQKCVEVCKSALAAGKSVVVDNTNPDAESRKRYTDVAKKKSVTCRCFLFTTSKPHSKHNERFRELTDKSHQSINDMVMNTYRSKFTEPATDEGFSEIVSVTFVPKFKNKEHETLYKQFLVEK